MRFPIEIQRAGRIAALVVAVVVAVLIFAAAMLRGPVPVAEAQPSDGAPPVTVEVAEARESEMAATLWAPGTVVSKNDARIAAEIAGRLVWVAEIGDEVKTGAVVARIDDRALRLKLREDEARIKRLEVNQRYLETQQRRLEALEAEQIAARTQLDEMVSRREMADQEIVEARLSRDQTLDRLARTEVRAPFPGQVVERFQQLGEYTSVGGPLVRLVDIRHLEVRAQAPLAVAPHLHAEMPVRVQDDKGREITSRVRAVIPVGDEKSRMFELRVEGPSTQIRSPWVVGAAVRVAVPQSEQVTAVSVPRDALILRQDSVYLFRVRDDGTVERLDVEPGIGNGTRIEVRGGVKAGDRVVVRGGERLRPGQAVFVP